MEKWYLLYSHFLRTKKKYDDKIRKNYLCVLVEELAELMVVVGEVEEEGPELHLLQDVVSALQAEDDLLQQGRGILRRRWSIRVLQYTTQLSVKVI